MNDFPRDPKAITSFSNPLVKRIKRLNRRKNRNEEGLFFIEGLRVVISAIEAQTPMDTIVYCPALLKSEIAWQALEKQASLGVNAPTGVDGGNESSFNSAPNSAKALIRIVCFPAPDCFIQSTRPVDRKSGAP